MTFQESIKRDQIQSILDRVNSIDLQQFPSTRERLMQIVAKLQQGKVLSESDYQTMKLNQLK